MRQREKVLFICHNHPTICPGGAEEYALELYHAIRDTDDMEAVLLARSGPPISSSRQANESLPITLVTGDPHQYFFYTDVFEWDRIYGRSAAKERLTMEFSDFLVAQAPTVVHFHHTTFLGYDMLRVTRNALPRARLIYTLHDFMPMCFHDGKLVTTQGYRPCMNPSPRGCHECFPTTSQQTFFMRERFIKSHFSVVDQFIAPSRFLAERFIEWGLAADRITIEDYGRIPVTREPDATSHRHRNRFAFLGQLSRFKGVDVLLRAAIILSERSIDAKVRIHGANLRWAPSGFRTR